MKCCMNQLVPELCLWAFLLAMHLLSGGSIARWLLNLSKRKSADHPVEITIQSADATLKREDRQGEMEAQLGCHVRRCSLTDRWRMQLWIAFNRQAGHVGPGEFRRQEQGVGQPITGRFVRDESTLGRAAAKAFMMIWLRVCFGGWLFRHHADSRLQAKLQAAMVVMMMIAADAACLTRIGVVVMLAGAQATRAAAEHAVNDHCQNCHHCCRSSRHLYKSHAIGKTSAFGIFVPGMGLPLAVSRGIGGRVRDRSTAVADSPPSAADCPETGKNGSHADQAGNRAFAVHRI